MEKTAVDERACTGILFLGRGAGRCGVCGDTQWHNGIGVFDSSAGFDTAMGDVSADKRFITLHDQVTDLDGLALADSQYAVFDKWITAVRAAGINYRRLDRSAGRLDIGKNCLNWISLDPCLNPMVHR